MTRYFVALLLFFALSGVEQAQGAVQSKKCKSFDGGDWGLLWDKLAQAEPRLDQQLKFMLKETKQDKKATFAFSTCELLYAVNKNGKLTNGYWTLVIHHAWVDVNGDSQARGMRIVWRPDFSTIASGESVFSAKPTKLGFAVCGETHVCESLDILGVKRVPETFVKEPLGNSWESPSPLDDQSLEIPDPFEEALRKSGRIG